MADLAQHTNYTGKYSGLLDNLWVTLGIAGVCLVGYEIEVRIPRRRGRDGTYRRVAVRILLAARQGWGRWWSGELRWGGQGRSSDRPSTEGFLREKALMSDPEEEARRRLGSREAWEFGYIFQPKAWRLNPGPPLPRWPLAWIASSLKVRERDMPETCGLDLTLHARFLRGSFFYTLLQTCVVLPILLPLHVIYAPSSVSRTSMVKASVSSLVESSGSKWLWIHAFLIWWVTLTWTGTVLWITWGALAYRRRDLRRLAEQVKQSREAKRRTYAGELGLKPDDVDRWTVGEDCEGVKRFRTVMVTNVPPDMRYEDKLRDYFDYYLRRHRLRRGQLSSTSAPDTPRISRDSREESRTVSELAKNHLNPAKLLRKRNEPKPEPIPERTPPSQTIDGFGQEPSDSMCQHEGNEIGNESAHEESMVEEIILVRKLASLASLRARRTDVLRKLEIAHVNLAKRVLHAVAKHKAKFPKSGKNPVIIHPALDLEKGGLAHLNAMRDERLPTHISKNERMERLSNALGGFTGDEPEQLGRGRHTVWDALHALPRELLDPYQSLTHLTSLFRNQNAPLIDYLTTKLNYLTMLLDEARSAPLSSFPTSSAAFVTFRDAKTARLALKILDSHPKRSLACHTVSAPDWTDILWPRLAKSVYRSSFVRNWVVFLAVWAFTLVWIFPVSFFTALASLTNIAGFLKPLQAFLDAHPKAASAITSLAPVILVALLTLTICPILLLIANKAETVTTRLAVHNSVLERFWKFLMVNSVVFFAIGQTAIEAYLTAFETKDFDPLPIVASSFPTAAPYFASYILLQTAIQPFFELFRFGLATIIYVFGTRVSVIPRQRDSRTEHPTFSHFSQLPLQLLGGAIMHLFMLLNPLVIPFALVYYGSCYLIWKRQFTYVYGRLYETNGRRSSIRILRYSLDALALGQFVLFAFFILNKAKGHAIGTGVLFFITLIAKLVITRALKRRFDNLDIEEADLLCPPMSREQQDLGIDQESIMDGFSPSGVAGESPASKSTARSSRRLATMRDSMSSWMGKWVYAVRKDTPVGYRKPIPFDHIFSSLDSKISFDLDDTSGSISRNQIAHSEVDKELQHEPDHPISHLPVTRVVVPHHPLRPWEDIPPYQRARGYNDQPAYTDDYDDFMWLPRDPLSTLDLDDTVEMRLALTTSAGGSGRLGGWPPVLDQFEDGSEHEDRDGPEADIRREVMTPESQAPDGSPMANSERRLLEHLELPSNIGSEVNQGTGAGLMRRGTRKATEGLSALFRRPRSNTDRSEGGISMRTLSISSQPVRRSEASPSTMTVAESALPSMSAAQTSDNSVFLSPTRVSTPRPVSERQPSSEQAQNPTDPVPASSPSLRMESSLSARLSRSPSGRRPAGRRATVTYDESEPLRTPSGSRGIGRSMSIISPQRSRSRDVTRSTSVFSARQQALMEEVMAEERIASQSGEKETQEELKREEAEVLREKERLRRAAAQSDAEDAMQRNASRRFSEKAGARPEVGRGASAASAGTVGSRGSAITTSSERVSVSRAQAAEGVRSGV